MILKHLNLLKKVWLYVLIGVGIGAIIHNWIPAEVIQSILGESNPFSVLLATAVGTPMYANIFGTLPVAEALFFKGVGVGTVLAFMMIAKYGVMKTPALVVDNKVLSYGKLLSPNQIVTLIKKAIDK